VSRWVGLLWGVAAVVAGRARQGCGSRLASAGEHRPVSNHMSIWDSGPVLSRTPPALRSPRPGTDRPAGHGKADASLD
jgi:hypothetical protein